MIFVGTAGWSIPGSLLDQFPAQGSALQRYAQRFTCCEINSTFYKRHQPQTFARWAASVSDDFKFLLKMPKSITHTRRLVDCERLVAEFLEDSSPLGAGRAVLLVQLPPSLVYEPKVADHFFSYLRQGYGGGVACEPRHPTWFAPRVELLWKRHEVARVAADPGGDIPPSAEPAGWPRLSYFRWHGSPRMYYSRYERFRIQELAEAARDCTGDVYCIFDNTALGEATQNGLELLEELRILAPRP